VFQSAALAIVIKEWAFVIAVLRQHSFTTSVDAPRRRGDALLSSRSQQQEQEEQRRREGFPRGGKSLYDSSSDTWSRAGRKNSMWTGEQQVTCVRTLAIVYVLVFAVLCTSAFIVSPCCFHVVFMLFALALSLSFPWLLTFADLRGKHPNIFFFFSSSSFIHR
jgi:hypothetical protein